MGEKNGYRLIEKMTLTFMWGFTCMTLFYLAAVYKELPSKIPMHFNFWGQPDRYGNKIEIMILPIIQIILSVSMHATLRELRKARYEDKEDNTRNRNVSCTVALGTSMLFFWIVFSSTYFGNVGRYTVFVIFGGVIGIFGYGYTYHRRKFGKKEKKESRESADEGDAVRYEGKVGVWMYVLLIFIHLIILKGLMDDVSKRGVNMGELAVILFTILLVDLIMLPMMWRNYVLLKEQELMIYFGFFKKRIAYKHIRTLKPTHNPLSSWAMSLDRIYIYTDSGDDIMIAVKRRNEFIEDVQSRCINQ